MQMRVGLLQRSDCGPRKEDLLAKGETYCRQAAAPEAGRPRKYYRLLPAGAKQLEQWQAEWETFAQAVEHILKGARPDAQS